MDVRRESRRAMIDDYTMTELIRRRFPDAQVEIFDMTGTMDHLSVLVRSEAFRNVALMDRHRMVEAAVKEARDDGRLHAMSLRTETLE